MRSPGQWRKARRYGRHAAILCDLMVHRYGRTSWDIAEDLGRIHYRVRHDLERLHRAGLVETRWKMPGILIYQLAAQSTAGDGQRGAQDTGSTAGTRHYLATGRDYREGPWWTTT